MSFADLITLIASVGTISGLVIYFFNKRLGDRTAVASITKTNKEVEQIEQEIETKYALQAQKWFDDLQDIKIKHELALAKKDEQILDCQTKHNSVMAETKEQTLKLERLGRATRKILANMDVPYWECDGEGKLVYVNGAWLKLFGTTSQQALDKGQGWLVSVPEEERDSLVIAWNARVVDQTEDSIEFNVRNPHTMQTTRVKSLYTLIFDSQNNIFKIMGITMPIPNNTLQNR